MTEIEALRKNLADARAAVRTAVYAGKWGEAARLFDEVELLRLTVEELAVCYSGGGDDLENDYDHDSDELFTKNVVLRGIRGILADAGYALVPLAEAARLEER